MTKAQQIELLLQCGYLVAPRKINPLTALVPTPTYFKERISGLELVIPKIPFHTQLIPLKALLASCPY